jgi:hypothetical protein
MLTLGQCPTCKKQWEYTQCVEDAGGCNQVSANEGWYQGLDETVSNLIEELNIKEKTIH